MEKLELELWLQENLSLISKLDIEKLKEIKKILTGECSSTVMLHYDRGTFHRIRCIKVPESAKPNIQDMLEEAYKRAEEDGYVGFGSAMPARYLEDAGFSIVAAYCEHIDDFHIGRTEYEKHGYYRFQCELCSSYYCGHCMSSCEMVEPDESKDCFHTPSEHVFEIRYKGKPVINFLMLSDTDVDEDVYPNDKVIDILHMFAPTDEAVRAVLDQPDFDILSLQLCDEEGNTIVQ